MHQSSELPRIWVTGAAGLIGNYIAQSASLWAPQWKVVPLTRAELDLTDLAAVEKRFGADRPLAIIHCAALSSATLCHANPALARRINVEATEHLAGLSSNIGFIFLSSDLVFDGNKGRYAEDAPVSPLSVYGETKAAAEEVVRKNRRHTVLRIGLNYGFSLDGSRSFNEQLCAAWRAGQRARLFFDEFRCPIPAPITARAIWELAAKSAAGLYHLAGSERLSRLQIGQLLAARCPELNPRIEPCSQQSYSGPPRPPDVSLDCSKVRSLLSFALPAFSHWLATSSGPS